MSIEMEYPNVTAEYLKNIILSKKSKADFIDKAMNDIQTINGTKDHDYVIVLEKMKNEKYITYDTIVKNADSLKKEKPSISQQKIDGIKIFLLYKQAQVFFNTNKDSVRHR